MPNYIAALMSIFINYNVYSCKNLTIFCISNKQILTILI